MSTDTDIEGFVDALRRDGPSDRDAARMQARLAALGVVTGASIAKGAVASSLPAGKMAAGVATRWASLSLLPKIGVVTAVSATALAGAVAVHQRDEALPAARSAEHVAAATRSAVPAAKRDGVAAAPQATEPTVRAVGPAQQATSGAARAPQLGAPPAKNAVAAAPAPAGEAAPVAPPSEAATASFDGVANTAPAATSTLPEETALIDAAFAALRAGDTATASALVAEHARRFPNGLLSREREHARERLSKANAAAPLR
jgi:hypothetical protein